MNTKIKPTYEPVPVGWHMPQKIELRQEQNEAIKDTMDYFGKAFAPKKGKKDDASAGSPKFLWNAKMRFGKTLSALELLKQMGVRRTLIVTHRPAVKDQWREDFNKIFTDELAAKSRFGYRLDHESQEDRKRKLAEGVLEFDELRRFADQSEENQIVFFVSMQYLRLSSKVGGGDTSKTKEKILDADWDMVIIDEAHEGTKTDRGENVIEYLAKPGVMTLHLSGTPFNIYEEFKSEQIFSWDYPKEQSRKAQWDTLPENQGKPNPYLTLPHMNIMRYDMSKMVEHFVEKIANSENGQIVAKDGEFKFTEFFRVVEDRDNPRYGKFVYEDEVKAFIRKLRKKDDNNFPFSNDEFRRSFAHTLWILPRVAAAKALEELLLEDDVFGKFTIINVAGKNDDDITDDDSLARVNKRIDSKYGGSEPRSITISCGRLTTGVTVRPWTAVLYMKGSDLTSPATYMQTIFRVQSPYTYTDKKTGKRMMKSECYAFDFAPTRALNMVAETAVLATKISKEQQKKATSGKSRKDADRAQSMEHISEMLKHLDMMSYDGVSLKPIDADILFSHLNGAYADRITRNGFDDFRLFDFDAIDSMSPEERKALGEDGEWLKNVTNSGVAKSNGSTPLDLTQLDDEQSAALESAKKKVVAFSDYQEWWKSLDKLERIMAAFFHKQEGRSLHPGYKDVEKKQSKKKDPATEEDKEIDELKKNQEKERKALASTLKSVAVRIPLLIYGAELTGKYEGQDITIDNITEIVDDESWREFMPKSGSKEIDKKWFKKYKKYFHSEIFRLAGQKYRRLAEEADEMHTEDRIQRITEIFDTFRNPDKETVLTPWRVVNMHISDTLGGYCFYNDSFTDANREKAEIKEDGENRIVMTRSPRLIPPNDVSRQIFNNINPLSGESNSRILEINSKTGLYPLYMAYSIYRPLLDNHWGAVCEDGKNTSVQEEHAIWDQVLRDNIFVVCKTEMARSITQRTLRGFRKDEQGNDVQVNAVWPQWKISNSGKKPISLSNGKEILPGETAKVDMVDLLRLAPNTFETTVKSREWWESVDPRNKLKFKKEMPKNIAFDAVVGNPPYQITTAKKETDNGQKRVANIFHLFQMASDNIGRYTSLIYPGGRWIHRSGKGMSKFGLDQINSSSLKILEFIENADFIFDKVDISDGLTIVLKDSKKKDDTFEYIFNRDGKKSSATLTAPGEELIPLNPINKKVSDSIDKIVQHKHFAYLHDSVLSQKLFGIESDFVEKNPGKVRLFEDGDSYNSETEVKLFTNDKAGKSGRARWYIGPKDVIQNGKEYLNQWKVVVSSANAGSQKRNNQIAIFDKNSAFGRSRVALKTFETEEEARNFYNYCQTDLIRFAMLLTDEALTSFAKRVPDILNYKNDNDYIDFSKDVNEEVYSLFDIKDKETKDFIRQFVADKSKN